MKKIIFGFLFAIFFQMLLAQDFNKASAYFDTENYESAAIEFEHIIFVIEQEPELIDSSSYAYCLTYTAVSFERSNQIEKAESYYLKAQSIYKKNPSWNKTMYSSVLNNLGQLYSSMGRYDEAEPLLKESIQIAKALNGKNQNGYGTSLNNLAMLYKAMGRYEQAELLMKEVLQIDKKSLGVNNPSYVRDLNNMATLYQDMGLYELAEPLLKEALIIAKKSYGENHPNYCSSLNNLAILYQDMGLYNEAEPLMKEAVRITKESLGENHPTYAISLLNLSTLYSDMGEYEQVESLIQQALQINRVQLGENHPAYSGCLISLANFYKEMGRFEEAEPLMIQVIKITKEFLGENHPDYSDYLNDLALLYQDMGRYNQAETLMEESMRITKESLGANHPDYATRLNNLAIIYIEISQFEKAEPLMIEATKIDKATLGESHPNYVVDLNNLSQLYSRMGRYEEAILKAKEIIEIDKIQFGENNPEYAAHLNNLGLLYAEMNQFEQAEPLFLKAIAIIETRFNYNNFEYVLLLDNLTGLYQAIGKYMQANFLMKKTYSILKDNLRNNSGYLSEEELSKFQEKVISNLEIYQSINYQQAISTGHLGDFAMDIELFQKGLLLNSVIDTRKRILNSGDAALTNSYQTMITYRKQADKLYSMPKEQRYEDPAILEQKANDIEKDLKLKSKEYSRSLEVAEITWRQIQGKMKPEEAIVEFASFGYYNKQWTDSTLYCALVLRKQDTIPHMVYLFEEKQLAEALPKSGNSSDATINNTYAVLRGNQLVQDSSWYQVDNLYNLVWKPLDSLLSGTKTVNYACSGLLNSVSFAAIPDASGKLLCDKYALNQYSSTRNLVFETNELPITDAIIYGGIQYELDTTLMISNSRQYSISNDLALAFNSTRSGNKRGRGFDELEGTREEAYAINALLEEKKITTNNYTDAAANEESFKAMASKKSPSVIHLSTHGFYYPDTITQREHSNEIQFIGYDLNRFQYSADPLLRSGIVLAGANRVWRGEPVPSGVEDGILTAKDVSQLNLSNTQLVVLSACQTGLGDVKGSEGVFGLQRAFKMAGVRYLMMSLWSVPDKETKEFMEKFYTHWLSGVSIRLAFQITQLKMRREYPQDPYKWAAFVLVE